MKSKNIFKRVFLYILFLPLLPIMAYTAFLTLSLDFKSIQDFNPEREEFKFSTVKNRLF